MPKKLSINQKSVTELLATKDADFIIPDYQRPYSWDEVECATLWDDIYSFAIPDNDYSAFDESDEYFLGPIVVFKNNDGKSEIIDGQQRLTTLMLLLRAFYEAFGDSMQDPNSLDTKREIAKCLWKADAFGRPVTPLKLKIDSEVATDNDKEEFIKILQQGQAPSDLKSRYATNYRFFQDKIHDFITDAPSYFPYLPIRILCNCILLPIEAESQDTALRIFSTLNDRGKPLSDSDIFKAHLYKAATKKGVKDTFITQWKDLENICEKIFQPKTGVPTDEIFTRYMYYERAKKGVRDYYTVEALRKFYEADGYKLFTENYEQTFSNLLSLANFWLSIHKRNEDVFSQRILRRLFVLSQAPNGMWTYITSVYFMHNRDINGLLDEEKFYVFLNKITAFIWAYTIMRPGITSLRGPLLSEMVDIIKGKDAAFSNYKFDADGLRNTLSNFIFSGNRPITRSMLVWWAFNDEHQELLPKGTRLEIEHIYAKNRSPVPTNLEALGNKSMLEKDINIRASDYRFRDKAKYYLGQVPGKPPTGIYELSNMASTKQDFTEQDIAQRTRIILDSFMNFISDNNLFR